VVGEDPLAGVDVGGVEPGPVDLAERPFDDRHLLGADLPGLLGGGEVRAQHRQRLTQRGGPRPHRGRRVDPAGRFRPRDRQCRGQHPPHRPLTQAGRQVPPLHVGDQPVVDQRQPVAGLLEGLQHPDQTRIVQCFQAVIGDDLDQVVDAGRQRVQGVLDRRQHTVDPPQIHHHSIIEHTYECKAFARRGELGRRTGAPVGRQLS
jgi:hypothetical protein